MLRCRCAESPRSANCDPTGRGNDCRAPHCSSKECREFAGEQAQDRVGIPLTLTRAKECSLSQTGISAHSVLWGCLLLAVVCEKRTEVAERAALPSSDCLATLALSCQRWTQWPSSLSRLKNIPKRANGSQSLVLSSPFWCLYRTLRCLVFELLQDMSTYLL